MGKMRIQCDIKSVAKQAHFLIFSLLAKKQVAEALTSMNIIEVRCPKSKVRVEMAGVRA